MNVSVGLVEARPAIELELIGSFKDGAGKTYSSGRHRFTSELVLVPQDASSAFALDDVTIGIGFHWERKERQVFRGGLRILKREAGLTVVNDVDLEEYVTSVISSEMSASCPLELLKAHAVISRSWLRQSSPSGRARSEGPGEGSHEIIRWYGREAHPDFDVCADDHCQRYQGITKAFSVAASQAVQATSGQFLMYQGQICDARFSKCCGGITELYSTAWENQDFEYLKSFYDGPGQMSESSAETFIQSEPPAYCNTRDSDLLRRILPGFDQETRDFYRWSVEYSPDEVRDLIQSRLGIDLGLIQDIRSEARGPSGRIYRLKIIGQKDFLIIGKELEIRRALSRSHLYSSAFVVEKEAARSASATARSLKKFILRGAGWGHGVGLCQIGAAVMASEGKTYREILEHYYRGATVS
jgi:stage II sporulation protein D